MTDDALHRYKVARLLRDWRARTGTEPCSDCQPTVAASPDDIALHGVAAPFDLPTGDGRMIAAGALEWDLEVEGVPIIWDLDDGDHTGQIVGRLDTIVDSGGTLDVSGRLFALGPVELDRLVNLISENAIGWSLGLDDVESETRWSEPDVVEEKDGTVVVRHTRERELTTVTHARVRHLALVDTPAFPVARPVLGQAPEPLAAAAQMHPYPASHFERWESRLPVPLQVTRDGKVWGHAAGDGCFRGNQGVCAKYTVDPDPAMRNFHTGTLELDNGEVIRVGTLTGASLHADPKDHRVSSQRAHHENTSTIWAKVIAWDDARGRLCITGSVVPGLDPVVLAQVAGQPVSVEKWPIPGVRGVTLVGAHTVNMPAWPVVASG